MTEQKLKQLLGEVRSFEWKNDENGNRVLFCNDKEILTIMEKEHGHYAAYTKGDAEYVIISGTGKTSIKQVLDFIKEKYKIPTQIN